jgi:transposase-like protein
LVRATVLDDASKARVRAEIHRNVATGATIYSDSHPYYHNLGTEGFMHDVVDHAQEYVVGRVHTNGLENFWSLVKRALHGTYVSVEPFHIFRYLDEQTFRFNNRGANDGQRFVRLVKEIVGKRLTYDHLTGADRRQYA